MSRAALAALMASAAYSAAAVTPLTTWHDYNIPRLIEQSKLPAEVYRGRVLWLQECALCHDGVGQPTYHTLGPWLSADIVRSLGDDAVRAIIDAGSPGMPEFKYNLRPQQVSDLIAFLKTVPQQPTADQLAGKVSAASRSGTD